MSNVEFEEPIVPLTPTIHREEKNITGFIIKTGLVKNKSQANLVMIGVILLCLIIMASIFMSGGSGEESKRVPVEEINRIMN